MPKTILLTGATDGIGLAAAKHLLEAGHHLLLHGRNADKLEALKAEFADAPGRCETYRADLSRLDEVSALADSILKDHTALDALINNAGVLKTAEPITPEGWDVHLVVNTLAPYQLTRRLLPLLGPGGRVVNVGSAAQAPVDIAALTGKQDPLTAMAAYSMSKLALTMWSNALARELDGKGPALITLNPGSLLATKMVHEGFGIEGSDVQIGADILVRSVLSDEFADANGRYYDNDSKQFADPHPDALDAEKCREVMEAVEGLLGKHE